ncbi:MAG: hypothetical protein HKO59_13375 [Phycisphaerales bacterium]|nr:hypothetical protein [Phycisphaerae bacterium]NNF44747.1 hypothetical protein [Phycisphaerales bacterium]NNM26953.1 hypothetical protein [Phycisphaerales bacterium]
MTTLSSHAPPSAPPSGVTLDADEFKELMSAFTDTTRQLEQTHLALRQEVARLTEELDEANAQLRRSRDLAALGQMAAGIAHEIRNPLASIQLYAQMLAADLPDASESHAVCGKISRAVGRLDGIVHDVLHFARETRVRAQATSAVDLFEHARLECEALLTRWPGRVEVHVDASSRCDLKADVCLLTQALANLIRNAIEAMDGGVGTLRFAGERRRMRRADGRRVERVVLIVEDDGPGIPEDVVVRMFNPFFTTRPTGTGLGLAIVHRIVDAHGGLINVKRAETGGARVELCLPVRPPTARTNSRTTGNAGSRRDSTVRTTSERR